jgi:hypothetical protein
MVRRIYAVDTENVLVVAALLQDAIIRISDIRHLPKSRQLVITGARLDRSGKRPMRQNFLLRIFDVDRVRGRNFGAPKDKGYTVLLAMELGVDDRELWCRFAGGGDLCVSVTALRMQMSDHDQPWLAKALPSHEGTT